MKLTPRQRAFLDKLYELYRERREPVHYTLVAEKLGVNKFSAYDMLRVLERKKMVASEYVLAKGSGPGRSMIVFYPTNKAAELLSSFLADRVRLSEEWQQAKERMLQRLQEVSKTNYKKLVDEMLNKLPEQKSPLIYCAETMTALLLNLSRVREKAGEMNPLKALPSLSSAGEVSIGTLAGLSLGSILTERDESLLRKKLLFHIKRCQVRLLELSRENRKLLSDFLQEAVAVFNRSL